MLAQNCDVARACMYSLECKRVPAICHCRDLQKKEKLITRRGIYSAEQSRRFTNFAGIGDFDSKLYSARNGIYT